MDFKAKDFSLRGPPKPHIVYIRLKLRSSHQAARNTERLSVVVKKLKVFN